MSAQARPLTVLLLGGTGVFGSRLAQMARADGHRVVTAARSAGTADLSLDRDDPADLAGALKSLAPDVVIDAAGPFQDYGPSPYRVARAALDAGAHYLDLSDDAAFTAGIVTLDRAALGAGRAALSGVSSVPALSSAAVSSLVGGLDRIELIHVAILPGNRAPRGRSVMRAILGQAGAPMRLWRGGRWREVSGWSDHRRIRLDPGTVRTAAVIGAPDLTLFPGRFGARSVVFRAGLELPLLHRGLGAMASLRRAGLLPDLARLTGPVLGLARVFERFGTDRGGMVVEVGGRTADGRAELRRWVLVAGRGDGPFIPGIPAVALLPRLAAGQVPAGARPAVAELPLDACVAALGRLDVTTRTETLAHQPLFEAALGRRWAGLPAGIRRLHEVWDVASASGRAEVVRGRGWLARTIAGAFRFPPTSADVPVRVTMTRTPRGETWVRRFGKRSFRSHLSPGEPGRVWERFGLFRFELPLVADDRSLAMPVARGRVLGLPIPGALLPRAEAVESMRDGRFTFDVRLSAPLVGLIVHYRGWLDPDDLSPDGCDQLDMG